MSFFKVSDSYLFHYEILYDTEFKEKIVKFEAHIAHKKKNTVRRKVHFSRFSSNLVILADVLYDL